MKSYLTIDDMQLSGKTVLCRVDINCPIDPVSRKIKDDTRIKLHSTTTLKELSDKGAKVVVMSHQGRPGSTDFVSLEDHAKLMEKHLGKPVKFVDDIFGSNAREKIKALQNGEVLLLENVRFYSEEMLNRPSDAHANVLLVKKLSEVSDYFVNDAFGAIHRSQPSLVGFGESVPTLAGRVIEGELKSLDKVFNSPESPIVFVMGGVKVEESLKVIKNLMKNNIADKVLTGGLLGNLFLAAKGYEIGKSSMEVLKGKGIDKLLPIAKELIRKHEDKIETPVDVAIKNGSREELHVSQLPTPYRIWDIGRETVGRYCKIIEEAKTIVMNSPMGAYENENYKYGTERILNDIAEKNIFKIVGGGHVGEMITRLGFKEKFSHVSSGGRATLYYLSGERTPVISVLKRAKNKWGKEN